MARPNEQFWNSTQGRIVVLLRGGDRTVKEMADTLKLTGNAVRAHLTALERDRLVRPTGSRPGTRKPIVTYGLTEEAGQLFPRAYGAILGHLLDVLKERTTAGAVEEIVRAVGHRMAPDYRAPVGGAAAGDLDRALVVLRDLGGFCDSETRGETVVLRCTDCPLAAVVARHPEVCRLVETLLADVLEAPVRERCKPPRCEFEVTAGSASVANSDRRT